MNKKILYVDMDGVLVNFWNTAKKFIYKCDTDEAKSFYEKHPSMIRGVFRDSFPMYHAIESIKKLNGSGKYDIYIATSPPFDAPESWEHKVNWLSKFFGNLFKNKIVMTHRKDLLIGDFLIDDRTVNGASDFNGKFIHFGTDKYKDWIDVIKELL